MKKGWLKLHRSIQYSDFYKDIPCKVLYFHLLLNAAFIGYSDKNNNVIPTGTYLTTYRGLAQETGLSVQQVRTALDKLEKLGEITKETVPTIRKTVTQVATQLSTQVATQRATQGQTLITLVKWSLFQVSPEEATQLSTQVATQRATQTSTHIYNNNNNNKNDYIRRCKKGGRAVKPNAFTDYTQTKYDYSKIEKLKLMRPKTDDEDTAEDIAIL